MDRQRLRDDLEFPVARPQSSGKLDIFVIGKELIPEDQTIDRDALPILSAFIAEDISAAGKELMSGNFKQAGLRLGSVIQGLTG